VGSVTASIWPATEERFGDYGGVSRLAASPEPPRHTPKALHSCISDWMPRSVMVTT